MEFEKKDLLLIVGFSIFIVAFILDIANHTAFLLYVLFAIFYRKRVIKEKEEEIEIDSSIANVVLLGLLIIWGGGAFWELDSNFISLLAWSLFLLYGLLGNMEKKVNGKYKLAFNITILILFMESLINYLL